MRRAETILRKAIKVSAVSSHRTEPEDWTHTLLKARKALVTMYTHGKFRDATKLQSYIRVKENATLRV
jgi:hypothetical protein